MAEPVAGDEEAEWQMAARKWWTEKRGMEGGGTKSYGTFKAVGVTNARDACSDSPC